MAVDLHQARWARREIEVGNAEAAHGRFSVACEHYEKAVELDSDNARVHIRLGGMQWQLSLVQAGASLKRAVELEPGFAVGHAALSAWFLQQGMTESADQSSLISMRLAPDDNTVLQSRSAVLEAMGEMNAAWEIVKRLVRRGFTPMPLMRLYGRMACQYEDQNAALELVESKLATLKLSARDQARLHFTAAELLDSLYRYDEAFVHARRGNSLAAALYDQAAHQRTFDTLIGYFTKQRLASLPRGNDRTGKPVFIVGMPRSGTSLVEQILASHSAVHGGGELDFMSHIWSGTVAMLRARLDQYPACLDRLTSEQADGMAQIYSQPLIALNPTASRITDKLPLNFLHLGLIHLLLPGARVIDVRRGRSDTCLSCYLAMFEAGNDFTYDLRHTAHFYDQHHRLMEHWKQNLDLPILEVSYEQLVMDPETQTRRLLNFLDLPWEETCLRFHQSKRPVTTSSVQQVRKPLYPTSIGRWRKYQRHLSDLE